MSKSNQQIAALLAGIGFAVGSNALASAAPALGGSVGGAVNGAAHGGVSAGGINAGVNAGIGANANGSLNGPNLPNHLPQTTLPSVNKPALPIPGIDQGPVQATITTIVGDTLTLKFANGTTQTITDAKAAAAFKSGQTVSLVQRDGGLMMTAVNGMANRAYHGVVTAVNGNALTLKLANGTTQTVTVANNAALNVKNGDTVTIAERDGKLIAMADKSVNRAEGLENRAYQGVVTAINGNVLTLKLANGTTQNVTVGNSTAGLKVGETIAIAERDNKVVALPQNAVHRATSLANRAYHGTVSAINGSAVTLKLANGATQTLTLSKAAAANLKTGENVTVAQHGTHLVVTATSSTKAHVNTRR